MQERPTPATSSPGALPAHHSQAGSRAAEISSQALAWMRVMIPLAAIVTAVVIYCCGGPTALALSIAAVGAAVGSGIQVTIHVRR
ncbi:hypothetical protein [Streptomyces syringium]|uniref:hypothetical protein n=1 Tax=Streptomyces syringium TaxID=76729 RepID=UPI003AAAE50E